MSFGFPRWRIGRSPVVTFSHRPQSADFCGPRNHNTVIRDSGTGDVPFCSLQARPKFRIGLVSGGQGCLKIDLFSSDWVVEFQVLGVQEISSIAGEAREILKRLAG